MIVFQNHSGSSTFIVRSSYNERKDVTKQKHYINETYNFVYML
jgi:hypothetical protein